MTTLVLASGSPRRLDLLTQIGLRPDVIAPDVDESILLDEAPISYVERLARAKAHAVVCGRGSVIIAADTIVVIDSQILGKPTDSDDAIEMLERLSGRTHEVLSGVAVRTDATTTSTVVSTIVEFVELEPATIAWYVATGEPLDKAGAYAIQGAGGSFVATVTGSPTNVIGLPLAQTETLLANVGHPTASFRGSAS